MPKDQFNNLPITTVTNAIPDLLSIFIMYKRDSCINEVSHENWIRLAKVREILNGAKTDLSCGVCKASLMDEITAFLKARGWFDGR